MSVFWTQFTENYIGLTEKFHVNPNSCGNPAHYENYLRFIALTDKKIGKGVTFVLLEEDDDTQEQTLIGFMTLKATCLITSVEGHAEGRSAIEITEFAVSKDYEKQGFGAYLIKLAVSIITDLKNKYIGVEYIVACADPFSVEFYEKCKFVQIMKYHKLPREGWNQDCIPMALKLPESTTP